MISLAAFSDERILETATNPIIAKTIPIAIGMARLTEESSSAAVQTTTPEEALAGDTTVYPSN